MPAEPAIDRLDSSATRSSPTCSRLEARRFQTSCRTLIWPSGQWRTWSLKGVPLHPDFTVPTAGGSAYNDVSEFSLGEALGDGPIVLTFFPAAFTGGYTDKTCAFQDTMPAFEDLDAQIHGVSVGLPFAQNIWIREHDLDFPIFSDWNHEVLRDYGVVREGTYNMIEAARRSIFVLDSEGVVRYKLGPRRRQPRFRGLHGYRPRRGS